MIDEKKLKEFLELLIAELDFHKLGDYSLKNLRELLEEIFE